MSVSSISKSIRRIFDRSRRGRSVDHRRLARAGLEAKRKSIVDAQGRAVGFTLHLVKVGT